MKKWILPVLLVFAMLFSFPVSAADGKLSAASALSSDGKSVTVTVTLTNPGIIATRIFVKYDTKALKLTSAENGSVFDSSRAVFGKNTSDNPYTLLWEDSLSSKNNTTSGVLCKLKFSVIGGSGSTNVEIQVDDGSTFDVNLDSVKVAGCSTSVKLGNGSAGTTVLVGDPTSAKATTTATTKPSTTKPTTTKPTTTKPTTTKPTTTKPTTTKSTTEVTTTAASTTQKNDSGSTVPQTSAGTLPEVSVVDVIDSPETDGEEFSAVLFADTESETLTEAEETAPESNKNLQLLWLLLLIPVAVIVVIFIKKKKA